MRLMSRTDGGPAPEGTRRAAAPLTVERVDKAYGAQPVLRDVALTGPAGSVLALLGPSGCGKTTLLRTMAGLERPDRGRVLMGDRPLVGPGTWVPPERRRIGMVFQDAALFPHLSVARNVAYGLPRRERGGARVRAALELVGLEDLAERMPATLSGGQQQRVALARAMATEPSVILLDEPFCALDAPLRVQLRLEVRRVLQAAGTTAVFVTHDQEEAFSVGDEVAVMLDGRIAQQGSPTELYELPASRAVAEFIGDANLVCGHAAGPWARTPLGPVPLSDSHSGAVKVMVRPERIVCSDGAGAVVEHVDYYGHDAVYRLRLACGNRLRSRVMGMPRYAPGDPVAVEFTGPPTVAYADERAGAPVAA
jgi:iron(III) transport system ATP-binding protein